MQVSQAQNMLLRPPYHVFSLLEATQAATAVQNRLQCYVRQVHRQMSTSSNARITPAIEAHLLRMQRRHADLCKQLTGVT